MSGRQRAFSFSGWVTRGFRAFDGSRGMVLGCVLPIRERRLRPWERCGRNTPKFALRSEHSSHRYWRAWMRSLRVRALRSANRSSQPRSAAGLKWLAMSRSLPARSRVAHREYACSE